MQRPRNVELKFPFPNLVELLRQRAQAAPDYPTFTFLVDGETDEATLTNRQLQERAQAIAAVLQERAAPGERALLLHPPGLDYIAAFFGCLYAGMIPVPAYPPEPTRLRKTLPRLQAIVRDATACFALTTSPVLALADSIFELAPDLRALQWIATDSIDDACRTAWKTPVVRRDDVVFLQYTSGSTSTPKGVELTHRNLLYNLEVIRHACGVLPERTLVSWVPPYHDMGLIAFILQPLYTGLRSILMSPLSFIERPMRWLEAISRYRAIISVAPNFGFELCVRRSDPQQRAQLDLSCVHSLGSGGEPVRADTVRRFYDAFEPCGLRRETFQPIYGLAETSLFASGIREPGHLAIKRVHRSGLAQNRVIPAISGGPGTTTFVGCGRIMQGDRLVIVDPVAAVPCPPGKIGEIWFASPSLARGYWNRPQESEETFRAYLADRGEGPFLRTGDLGFLDGGDLFVTGRMKDLIILNGTNHYAEDLETTVQNCSAVLRRGCGAAFSVDIDGMERVVVVQEVDVRQSFDSDQLIGDIRQSLSEEHQLAVYSIALIKPGSLIKTSSGKIQRHGCRLAFLNQSLDVVAEWRAGTSPPMRSRGSLVSLLTDELAAELGRSRSEIDPDTAITRFGIDSLAAYGLAHRIEQATGLRIDVESVVDGVTISELAQRLLNPSVESDQPRPAVPQIVPSPAVEYPLSHGQEALWYLNQLAPQSRAYHLAQAATVVGGLNVDALHSALRQLVDRHSALRTTFTSHLGQPRQKIHASVEIPLPQWDASGWSEEELAARLHDEAFRPFDLEKGPLLRAAICWRGESDPILVLSAHHIVLDLWSLAILMRELGMFYSASKQGGTISFPPLRHQYVDYVAWQAQSLAGGDGDRLSAYWQSKLLPQPRPLELATDHPRPVLQSFRGSTYLHTLDRELSRLLGDFAHDHESTLFTTLLAAFQVLLLRHSEQTEFLIGSPTLGRSRAEWSDIVGYFINPVALRADLKDDPAFSVVLDSARRNVAEALAAADYPFAMVVEKLHPQRDASRSPLFQVMFTLQNTAAIGNPNLAAFGLGQADVGLRLGDLQLVAWPMASPAAQFDLSLAIAELDGALCTAWQYNSDLFDAATIERMAGHFETLLDAIVADPSQPLSSLPVLSSAEDRQLRLEWNQTQHLFENPRCIHQLFEEQVRRSPDAVAVVAGTESLTFEALDRRANQLANYLNRLGVGPEIPVAICLERSLDMMVALVGILKAGGAYVPLEVDYPLERLRHMLTDSQPRVLLTHRRLRRRLPEYDGIIVELDSDMASIRRESHEPTHSGVIASNLAYILYTSGSTGYPKGVMNTHSAVSNYLLWLQKEFSLAPTDRLLQITSLSFDISVTECFWPLTSGASVSLAAPGGQRDPAYLVKLIVDDGVSVLQVVPSTLRLLLEQPSLEADSSLRLVLCGGEEMSRELNERFFERLSCELFNLYGPTEASVWATFWKCRPGGVGGVIPIGRPMSNVRVHILDSHRRMVPIGVVGELWLGGAGLARGYLNQPELTAEKFIDDPFRPDSGERLYRTGDLARYLPDGNIEYLGRIDQQIKLRGHRIELGEVEAVLAKHMSVAECAVSLRSDDGSSDRLVAYVVPRWEEPPKADDLRAFLQTRLPEYMLPATFVVLDKLPLTINGKLDRKALPAPHENPRPNPFVAPRTAEEFRLCLLWEQVLGFEPVGVHDDFFQLGGDSLRVAQLAARLSALTKKDVSVGFVLQHRNVAAAASALANLPLPEAPPTEERESPTATVEVQPEGSVIRHERRSLLSLLAAGKLETVHAAALAYFPTALLRNGAVDRREILDAWCDGLPLFSRVHETPMGRIATLLLPFFADQLYTAKDELLAVTTDALRMAKGLGAQVVSLTGLLPSATDYGRDLLRATEGMDVPRITTGHATTVATVVLAIKRILRAGRRDLTRERVAFLGLGSIGAASLEAMLQILPHPAELILSDLAARRAHLEAIRDGVVRRSGFQGRVRVLSSTEGTPDEIFEAGLIVGATNVADVLPVSQLRPGTIVVDDSAPHCFSVAEATERILRRKDLLCTEGGVLRAPSPLPQVRYTPRSLADFADAALLREFEPIDPREITGCVFSSGLSARVDSLAPTIGAVDARSSVQHFRALDELGFEAGALRCGGTLIPEATIQAFADHFGHSQ